MVSSTPTPVPAPSTDLTLEQCGHVFLSGDAYTHPEVFHGAAAKLRREDPIHWVEHPDVYPFWVLTRHADVMDIELHHQQFLNEPRAILGNRRGDDDRKARGGKHLVKSLVQMDDPEHKAHRELTANWFRPANLAKLNGRLDQLSQQAIDKMVAAGGSIDFASDVAMQYPLQVILAILGLPESDYGLMLKLTQEIFAPEDPDFQRDADAMAGLLQTVGEMVAYFNNVTADRKANPTEDLATVIANGIVAGQPIGLEEQLGYYIIAATAGHDTTSNAMSGGMLALLENPDQLARLQADPLLIASAVDEMIRWTSPVKHFMRTATEDYDLNGTKILAGQDVLLSYWSANHDEAEFADPFRFDIGREGSRHLAFGFGIHYCLGAMLAKMELRSLFGALVPRLASAEVAGTPEYTRSSFVSGLKRLPITYTLR